MMDPKDLVRELAAIQDRLIALPDDAYAQRWELRTRQDGLREQAKTFSYALFEDTFDEDLLEQLDALRREMKRIEKQRIDLVGQSGSSGAGMTTEGTHNAVTINMAMDAAAGMQDLKARIGTIKGVLTSRGVTFPVTD